MKANKNTIFYKDQKLFEKKPLNRMSKIEQLKRNESVFYNTWQFRMPERANGIHFRTKLQTPAIKTYRKIHILVDTFLLHKNGV